MTYLEIAHAKWVLVVLDLVKPIFVCAILGDSADGLGCSTTFVEIAHMKMGVPFWG